MSRWISLPCSAGYLSLNNVILSTPYHSPLWPYHGPTLTILALTQVKTGDPALFSIEERKSRESAAGGGSRAPSGGGGGGDGGGGGGGGDGGDGGGGGDKDDDGGGGSVAAGPNPDPNLHPTRMNAHKYTHTQQPRACVVLCITLIQTLTL